MSKVKICGLCSMEDVQAVNRALPDFAGLVFAQSRRRVNAQTAQILREGLDGRVKTVGVFVNEEIGVVAQLCRRGIVDLVQLHGDEDGEYIRQLRESCGCPIIKAVRVGSTVPPLPTSADFLLFDTASALRGGTGKTFNWSLLKNYSGPPYFLAGGLNAANVARALSLLKPYGVDVSGGVEAGGAKSPEKIGEFVRLVRGAK